MIQTQDPRLPKHNIKLWNLAVDLYGHLGRLGIEGRENPREFKYAIQALLSQKMLEFLIGDLATQISSQPTPEESSKEYKELVKYNGRMKELGLNVGLGINEA